MTVTSESDRAQAPTPHRHVRRWVAAALALLVVVGAAYGVRWWTHPDVLPDGGTMRMAPRPVAEAASAVVVASWTDRHAPTTLTVQSLHAELAEDTAATRVTFATCHDDPGDTPWVSWSMTDLSRVCRDLTPITPGERLTVPTPHHYLVAILTPTRPGVVHLTRVDVDESLGADHWFRRGTDSVALDRQLTAR